MAVDPVNDNFRTKGLPKRSSTLPGVDLSPKVITLNTPGGKPASSASLIKL